MGRCAQSRNKNAVTIECLLRVANKSFSLLQLTLSHRSVADLALCQFSKILSHDLARRIFRDSIDESDSTSKALVRRYLLCEPCSNLLSGHGLRFLERDVGTWQFLSLNRNTDDSSVLHSRVIEE